MAIYCITVYCIAVRQCAVNDSNLRDLAKFEYTDCKTKRTGQTNAKRLEIGNGKCSSVTYDLSAVAILNDPRFKWLSEFCGLHSPCSPFCLFTWFNAFFLQKFRRKYPRTVLPIISRNGGLRCCEREREKKHHLNPTHISAIHLRI